MECIKHYPGSRRPPRSELPRGVYVYRLVAGDKVYIGKGRRYRAWAHFWEAALYFWTRDPETTFNRQKAHHLHLAVGCTPELVRVEILAEELTDEQAFDLEVRAIAAVPEELRLNLTDGGDGMTPEDTARLRWGQDRLLTEEEKKERHATYMKVYREANHEQRTTRSRAYYVANREKVLAYMKAYREANREQRVAYFKAYREANREKASARDRAYYAANREKILAYQNTNPVIKERRRALARLRRAAKKAAMAALSPPA